MGRDAFLDALNDPKLRVRILEWERKDLDETLQLACRFEVYGKSTAPGSDGADGERDRPRGRPIRSVTSGAQTMDTEEHVRKLTKQVADLQSALAQCQQELKRNMECQKAKPEQLVTSEVPFVQPPRPEYSYVAAPWSANEVSQTSPSPTSRRSGLRRRNLSRYGQLG